MSRRVPRTRRVPAERQTSAEAGVALSLPPNVRPEEVRAGRLPVGRPEPWRTPLERATRPPSISPADPGYLPWLFATLADVAEHFTLAARTARELDETKMLIDSARLLRGIAFALARRDEKWLGQTGDAARRLLQRMSKDLRVPTLVHVDGYQSTAPFSLVAGDIVPKRTQIADRLRELVQSVLVRRQNVALHQPFHRAASAELAGSFRAIVRAYPSLAKKCLRLEVAGDLETAFFRELALAPRTNFADPPAGSAAGDGLVRHVLSELQTLEEFAERVAVAGLEVLGYPARDLRNYYDYARKRRAKRATLPIQRMLTRVLLEPPWALPSPRRMTRTPPP